MLFVPYDVEALLLHSSLALHLKLPFSFLYPHYLEDLHD